MRHFRTMHAPVTDSRNPRRAMRRALGDDLGSVALMFALMLPVLFGIIGLGVEVGMWFKERRELQTIADAAAVSAAIENTYGATQAELDAAALLEANRNGFDATTDDITYVGVPTQGAFTGQAGFIEVIVTRQLQTLLSQVFYTLSPATMARAVASTVSDQEACVLALSPSAQNAVYVNGAGTNVNMSGCSVVANSNDANAINVQNGSLAADCLWTAGGIDGMENITTACSNPVSGAATVDDPYADIDVPPIGSCDENPPGNTSYSPASGETLSEGVYCGGIQVSSGDTVYMNDGIYIMDEGDFSVQGGATLQSTGPQGVTIILTASDGSGYGTFNITGNATINLQAQTGEDTTGSYQGDYTGMLVYQDRNGPSSPSLDINMNGGSNAELMGAIYSPNNDISFNGGSTLDNNGCLMLVAQTVSFNGDASLDNECDMFGGNPVVYGASPGLVE